MFYLDHGVWYCRRCLDFGRLEWGEEDIPKQIFKRKWKGKPVLEFELTPFQKQISRQTLEALKEGEDVFVFAAAGAGKTEITLESICYYLSLGKKVCFAISRRQVVIEIAKRLSKNFPELSVVPVCEGFTEVTDGDLIVCTTHQLYRYKGCFDLLILDELDAFPYAGNEVLENLAESACRGQKLLLSATPDDKSMEAISKGEMKMVQLFRRPHGKPLCVPAVKACSNVSAVFRIVVQCRRFKKKNKQVLVFVPRKKDGVWMKEVLNFFVRCDLIHSSSLNKDEIMDKFHKKQTEVLVCTTLLERGITVPSVQVLVYRADHHVFTAASLIQIFGRVGRTFSDPYGTGICYCSGPSLEMEKCIRQLKAMNQSV